MNKTLKQGILAFLLGLTLMLALKGTGWAGAEDPVFFRYRVDKQWNVFGTTENSPTCSIDEEFNDGSRIQITKPLSDERFYIWIRNMKWEIGDKPEELYPAKINLYHGKKLVGGGQFAYYLRNKNEISFPNMPTNFIDQLGHADRMTFYMGGTIPNAEFDVPHIIDMFRGMIACVDAYRGPGSSIPQTSGNSPLKKTPQTSGSPPLKDEQKPKPKGESL